MHTSSLGSAEAIVSSPDCRFRQQLVGALQAANWRVEEAVGGADALLKLGGNNYRILLLDQALLDLEVTEVAQMARARCPDTSAYVLDKSHRRPVLSLDSQNGLHWGSVSPLLEHLWGPESNESRLQQEVSMSVPATEDDPLPEEELPLPDMIGRSPAMRQTYRLTRLVPPRKTTALVLGATGTGKELVTKAIHLLSPRNRGPSVSVNCAAIPESLLESELYGYMRGSFTGADQTRSGRLLMAHRGTLFLDEVGDLPVTAQAKLLRFLQDGEVQRLGSAEIFHADVRVVAATNAHLVERVRQGRFRNDLYHRLAVFPITVPPLHDRPEDILPLSLHFLARFCRDAGTLTALLQSASHLTPKRS